MSRPAIACDEFAPRIPWLANGTLDAGETAEVTAHVGGCAACAERLEGLRFLLGRLRDAPPGDLGEHVEAQLLVESIETPAVMELESRARVARHLDACVTCSEAERILRDLPSGPDTPGATEKVAPPQVAPTEAAPPSAPATRPWEVLRHRLLGPVAALVYLIVALVSLLVLLDRLRAPVAVPPRGAPAADTRPGPPPAARPAEPSGVLTPAQPIEAGQGWRAGTVQGGAATGSAHPVEIAVASGEPLLLDLDPDLAQDDRGREDRRFTLSLRGRNGWSFASRFDATRLDRRGRILVLVPGDRAPEPGMGEVALAREAPGTPDDGLVLWRVPVRFVPR